MAYQAKRSKKLLEEFQLVNEMGEVEKVIYMELNADEVVRKINQKYLDLVHMQQNMLSVNENMESKIEASEALEQLGTATVNLYEAVFGAEDTQMIVDFYENRYLEMAREVTPFIIHVIIPKVREIARESKKTILDAYKPKEKQSFLSRKK